MFLISYLHHSSDGLIGCGTDIVADLEEWFLGRSSVFDPKESSTVITNISIVSKPFAEKYAKLLNQNKKGE